MLFVKLLTCLFFSSGNFANEYYLIKDKNLDFAAPVISSLSQDRDEEVGTILYDVSTKIFKGRDHEGNWVNFNVPAGTDIVKTCFISDQKTSGTAGGSSPSAAFVIRDLNSTSGDCSFISFPNGFENSDYDNNGSSPDTTKQQFTLSSGTYAIEIDAPAKQCNAHRIALYEIGSGFNSYGTSEQSDPSSTTPTRSFLSTVLTLTEDKSYDVRHYTGTAKTTDGLGSNVSMGSDEVYTRVKVTKLQ